MEYTKIWRSSVSISLSKDTFEKMLQICDENFISRSRLIELAMREFIATRTKNNLILRDTTFNK